MPGALSHPLPIPSWDTEGISLMDTELNRIWQVIRQKTLKQMFLISWKSGNMLKLELGAGGLSFTKQINSPIKSFLILERSSSPCRLQNQKQASGSIWGNKWESWPSLLLFCDPEQDPQKPCAPRGFLRQRVITAPSPEGCPGRSCPYHRPHSSGPVTVLTVAVGQGTFGLLEQWKPSGSLTDALFVKWHFLSFQILSPSVSWWPSKP